MSDGLDFSDLTDDQIVGLATALAREAMSRDPALQAAFKQSLLDEKERVEAAAKGSERARRAERARVEKQAQAAALAQIKERERQRVHNALIAYLRAIADVIGHEISNLTLVWSQLNYGRGGHRLQINLGKTNELVRWHLIDYGADDERLYVSPGLRRKESEIMPWCREAVAAIRALQIDRTTIIRGIDQ